MQNRAARSLLGLAHREWFPRPPPPCASTGTMTPEIQFGVLPILSETSCIQTGWCATPKPAWSEEISLNSTELGTKSRAYLPWRVKEISRPHTKQCSQIEASPLSHTRKPDKCDCLAYAGESVNYKAPCYLSILLKMCITM